MRNLSGENFENPAKNDRSEEQGDKTIKKISITQGNREQPSEINAPNQ